MVNQCFENIEVTFNKGRIQQTKKIRGKLEKLALKVLVRNVYQMKDKSKTIEQD